MRWIATLLLLSGCYLSHERRGPPPHVPGPQAEEHLLGRVRVAEGVAVVEIDTNTGAVTELFRVERERSGVDWLAVPGWNVLVFRHTSSGSSSRDASFEVRRLPGGEVVHGLRGPDAASARGCTFDMVGSLRARSDGDIQTLPAAFDRRIPDSGRQSWRLDGRDFSCVGPRRVLGDPQVSAWVSARDLIDGQLHYLDGVSPGTGFFPEGSTRVKRVLDPDSWSVVSEERFEDYDLQADFFADGGRLFGMRPDDGTLYEANFDSGRIEPVAQTLPYVDRVPTAGAKPSVVRPLVYMLGMAEAGLELHVVDVRRGEARAVALDPGFAIDRLDVARY